MAILTRYADQQRGKQDRIWTLWQIRGKPVWRCKHPPSPKPLYGLDRLTARPADLVVICEGEKAAEAAQALWPEAVTVAWMGGANATRHADLTPLKDRDVVLWPDHDQPGIGAMQAMTNLLSALGVASLRQLNRDALTRSVRLQEGDDAADLVDREGWDADRFRRFLAEPDALIAPPDLPRAAQRYAAQVAAVQAWLREQKLKSDAVGRLVREGCIDYRLSYVETLNQLLHHLRAAGFDVAEKRAQEIVAYICNEQAREAFERLKSRILDAGSAPEDREIGERELVKFCRTVTGEDDVVAYWSLAHWIWLVKRSLAGMEREHDLMVILHGKQGDGKSTAARRFCAPLAELVHPITASVLTDERSARILQQAAVGLWDEMEGASKSDVEALKNTITCQEKTYRVLGTHQIGRALRLMNFLGTTNGEVADMIRDVTGARRWVQIDCQSPIDWEAVNAIDYQALWGVVHHEQPPPILTIRDELKTHQKTLVHKDSVSLWLEAEDWDRRDWEVNGTHRVLHPIRPETGAPAEDLRIRYHYWCRLMGEPTLGAALWGRRMRQMGWELFRPRDTGGKRPYSLRRRDDSLR